MQRSSFTPTELKEDPMSAYFLLKMEDNKSQLPRQVTTDSNLWKWHFHSDNSQTVGILIKLKQTRILL